MQLDYCVNPLPSQLYPHHAHIYDFLTRTLVWYMGGFGRWLESGLVVDVSVQFGAIGFVSIFFAGLRPLLASLVAIRALCSPVLAQQCGGMRDPSL